MEALKLRFEPSFAEKKLNFNVVTGENKEDVLRNFINQQGIDMIAFISHKTNLFSELFSRKLHKKDFFKQELPMLAIHEK